MQLPRQAQLLRIFIGEADRHGERPLYEAIVLKARELHIAGATVLRGGLGYGHSSRLHTAKILRLSSDLPLLVEIVDSEEKISAFLPVLDGMMTSGLITLENIQVLQYGDKLATRGVHGRRSCPPPMFISFVPSAGCFRGLQSDIRKLALRP